MSFGFSVGDFLAGLELVGTIIDAIRESGVVGQEYREILTKLYNLESALLQVKRLNTDEVDQNLAIPLRRAAGQCQKTIDKFFADIQSYEPHLRASTSSRDTWSSLGAKRSWYRIKWRLSRKDDILRFKSNLQGHTEAIQLLLITVQINAMALQRKSTRSFVGRIQDSYFKVMKRLDAVYTGVTTAVEQGKKMLLQTTSIVQRDVQVFQTLVQIQDSITRIPGQVERQQPVYLIDATGKWSPFHLEFVQSSEALISVLADNFKKYNASRMILHRAFVISDKATGRIIRIERNWESCFTPGQRVEMSANFRAENLTSQLPATCPRCAQDYNKVPIRFDKEYECSECGLVFSVVSPKKSSRRYWVKNQPSWTGYDSCTSNNTSSSMDYVRTTRKRSYLDAAFEEHKSRKRKRDDDVVEVLRFKKIRFLPPPFYDNWPY